MAQAMDTPGPQSYVALLGFSQKPKQRVARGPFSSRQPKSPAYSFPVAISESRTRHNRALGKRGKSRRRWAKRFFCES